MNGSESRERRLVEWLRTSRVVLGAAWFGLLGGLTQVTKSLLLSAQPRGMAQLLAYSLAGPLTGALLFLYWPVLSMAGRISARRNPQQRMTWHTQQTRKSQQVTFSAMMIFRLMGVTPDEARRLDAATPASYRWMRTFERRVQVRLKSGPFEGLHSIVVRQRMKEYRWRSEFTLAGIRSSTLRAVAAVATLGDGYEPDFSQADATEALRDLRQKVNPQDVVGWAIAARAALTEGIVTDDRLTPPTYGVDGTAVPAYRKVQRIYLPDGPIPGWLRLLAGVPMTETLPTDVDTDGLLVLAALRGHPIELVALPSFQPGHTHTGHPS